MKRLSMVTGLVVVLALVGSAAYAQRQDNPKVTGGGQIDVSGNGGAGNTLAFYGEEARGGDRGQVQYVATSTAGDGSAPAFWHGFVDCVNVNGNRGVLSGTTTMGTNFWLEVIDTGVPANNTDTIRINDNSEADCDEEDGDARSTELGRGNAVVHSGS